jgi:hypothetical protein
MGRAAGLRERLASIGAGERGGSSGRADPGAYLKPDLSQRWLGFLLPGSFLAFWLLNLAVGFDWRTVGLDARIYYQGSAAWLAGCGLPGVACGSSGPSPD